MAVSIVQAAVEELAGSVRAVAERLGLGAGGGFPLVLCARREGLGAPEGLSFSV